ncbi:MAG TPA: LpqB family beta-propeller domain-containing protein, partial [Jatrophihabitans sp.]|nr:LpqB family beta-propeller domain-containing protein [Jatrophihabitans sp.]
MSGRGRRGLGWLAVLAVLAGCTGIPASSAPQVVRTVPRSPVAGATVTPPTPHPGEPPGQVVDEFVGDAIYADAGHSTSRQYLTTGAARRWQDNQTVILDAYSRGDPQFSGDFTSALVPVTGRRVGQVDASGVYTPTLKGMGDGDQETFDFRLIKVAGEWRIDQPPPGVLIERNNFRRYYHQRSLYFFDSAQSVLVPDLRYTALGGQAEASWLLTELLGGPRRELAQTVVSAVPDQVGNSSVQIGNPTIVEMPGTGQLSAGDRNSLAAQLAFTLEQVQFSGGQLELTDSGKPVRIPTITTGLQFSKADFSSNAQPANSSPYSPQPAGALYFVRDGVVFTLDDKNKPVAAEFGQPNRNFSSVALRHGSAQSLQVAALTVANQLQVGGVAGLLPVKLPQPATSRPEWQPNSDNGDVWLGAGSRLYRVPAGGPVQPISLTSQAGALPAGPITAVRLSPDGDRVAL